MNIIYLFFKFLFLFSLKNSVNAYYGGYEGVFVWDKYYSFQTFKCLKKNYSTDFAIIQAFNHKGFVEKNLKLNYLNARKAGICDIDVYIYPCVQPSKRSRNCGNGRKTIESTLNYLKKNNIKVGRVWLSIFRVDKLDNLFGWYKNTDRNIEFIEEMIETLKECKQDYGIYTFDWLVITGNTQKFKDVPLLYDNQAVYTSFVNYANSTDNFDNFGEFGGWTRPTAKIYSYTRNCGIFVANVFKPTLSELKKCYN